MVKQKLEVMTREQVAEVMGVDPKDASGIVEGGDEGGTLEKSVFMLTNKLFDKAHLRMIARLNDTLAYYMIKHEALKLTFYDYYMKCRINYRLQAQDEPPYYRTCHQDVRPSPRGLSSSYREFIDIIYEITISFQGKGREEIRDLIRGLHGEIEKKEGGFWNKLMGRS